MRIAVAAALAAVLAALAASVAPASAAPRATAARGEILSVPWPREGDVTLAQAEVRLRSGVTPRVALRSARRFRRLAPRGVSVFASVQRTRRPGRAIVSVVAIRRAPPPRTAGAAHDHLAVPLRLRGGSFGRVRRAPSVLLMVEGGRRRPAFFRSYRSAGRGARIVAGRGLRGYRASRVMTLAFRLAVGRPFSGAKQFITAFGGTVPAALTPGGLRQGETTPVDGGSGGGAPGGGVHGGDGGGPVQPAVTCSVVFSPGLAPQQGGLRVSGCQDYGAFNTVRLRAPAGTTWASCSAPPDAACSVENPYIFWRFGSGVGDSGDLGATSANEPFARWRNHGAVHLSRDGGHTLDCVYGCP